MLNKVKIEYRMPAGEVGYIQVETAEDPVLVAAKAGHLAPTGCMITNASIVDNPGDADDPRGSDSP